MTDTRKLEDQTPENKSKVTGELKDGELDRVTGGGTNTTTQENKGQAEALKGFQQALQNLP